MKQQDKRYGLVALRNGQRLYDGASCTTATSNDDGSGDDPGPRTTNNDKNDHNDTAENDQNHQQHVHLRPFMCLDHAVADNDDGNGTLDVSLFNKRRHQLSVLRLTGRRSNYPATTVLDSFTVSGPKHDGGDSNNDRSRRNKSMINNVLILGRNELLMTLYAGCGCDEINRFDNARSSGARNCDDETNLPDNSTRSSDDNCERQRKGRRERDTGIPFAVTTEAVARRCRHCQRQTSWVRRYLSRQVLQFYSKTEAIEVSPGSEEIQQDSSNDNLRDPSNVTMRFRVGQSLPYCILLNGEKLKDNIDYDDNIDRGKRQHSGWSHRVLRLHLGDTIGIRCHPEALRACAASHPSGTCIDDFDDDECGANIDNVLEFQVVELFSREYNDGNDDAIKTLRNQEIVFASASSSLDTTMHVDDSLPKEDAETSRQIITDHRGTDDTSIAADFASPTIASTVSTNSSKEQRYDTTFAQEKRKSSTSPNSDVIYTVDRTYLRNDDSSTTATRNSSTTNTNTINSSNDDDRNCTDSAILTVDLGVKTLEKTTTTTRMILPVVPIENFFFPPFFGTKKFVIYLAVHEDNDGFARGLEQCRQIINDDVLHNHHLQFDGTRHITMWSGMMTSQQANQVSLRCSSNDSSKMAADLMTSFNAISFSGMCRWGDHGVYLKLAYESQQRLQWIVQTCIKGLPHESHHKCDHLSLYRPRGAQGWHKKMTNLAFGKINDVLGSYNWDPVKPHSVRVKIVGEEYNKCRVLIDFHDTAGQSLGANDVNTQSVSIDQIKKVQPKLASKEKDDGHDEIIARQTGQKIVSITKSEYSVSGKDHNITSETCEGTSQTSKMPERLLKPRLEPETSECSLGGITNLRHNLPVKTSLARVYLVAYGQDLSSNKRQKIERNLGRFGAIAWSDDDKPDINLDDYNIMIISKAVSSLEKVVPHIKKMKHWKAYRSLKAKKITTSVTDDILLQQYLREFNVYCVYSSWADSCVKSKSLLLPPPREDVWPYLPEVTTGEKTRKRDRECDSKEVVASISQGSHRSIKGSGSKRIKRYLPKNVELAAQFKELSELHRSMALAKDDQWKAYSLGVCASRLLRLDFEVNDDPDTIRKLESIKGFGKGTIDKIKQYLEEGKLRRIEEFKTDSERLAIQQFTNIWGVGMSRAKELLHAGYKSIEDILGGLKRGEIQLSRNQLVGVECYDDIHDNNRMERSEVEEIAHIVEQTAAALFPGIEVTIMGSYRRGKETCGDVDLHLTHPQYATKIPLDSLGRIVNALWDQKFIAFHLAVLNGMSSGLEIDDFAANSRRVPYSAWMQTKRIASDQSRKMEHDFWMGCVKSPVIQGTRRRVDIKFYPYRERVFASIYFTGNGFFNRSMRLWATYKHDMKLSDHGLFDRATGMKRIMEASTEREVFDFLQVKWKEPNERDGFDAMEPKDEEEHVVEFKSQKEFFKDSEDYIWVK